MATAAKTDVRAPGPTTAEEMLTWPHHLPGEIIDGVWVPRYPDGKVTGSGGKHGVVSLTVGHLLLSHVRPRRLGFVYGAEAAFRLRRGPDLVRCADAAFIAAARLPDGVPDGIFEGAPDLAVEVISPWSTTAEIRDKVADYLRFGARLVWVCHPRKRTIMTHVPGGSPRELRGDDVLDGGDVLPGFAVAASELFVDLDLPG